MDHEGVWGIREKSSCRARRKLGSCPRRTWDWPGARDWKFNFSECLTFFQSCPLTRDSAEAPTDELFEILLEQGRALRRETKRRDSLTAGPKKKA